MIFHFGVKFRDGRRRCCRRLPVLHGWRVREKIVVGWSSLVKGSRPTGTLMTSSTHHAVKRRPAELLRRRAWRRSCVCQGHWLRLGQLARDGRALAELSGTTAAVQDHRCIAHLGRNGLERPIPHHVRLRPGREARPPRKTQRRRTPCCSAPREPADRRRPSGRCHRKSLKPSQPKPTMVRAPPSAPAVGVVSEPAVAETADQPVAYAGVSIHAGDVLRHKQSLRPPAATPLTTWTLTTRQISGNGTGSTQG